MKEKKINIEDVGVSLQEESKKVHPRVLPSIALTHGINTISAIHNMSIKDLVGIFVNGVVPLYVGNYEKPTSDPGRKRDVEAFAGFISEIAKDEDLFQRAVQGYLDSQLKTTEELFDTVDHQLAGIEAKRRERDVIKSGIFSSLREKRVNAIHKEINDSEADALVEAFNSMVPAEYKFFLYDKHLVGIESTLADKKQKELDDRVNMIIGLGRPSREELFWYLHSKTPGSGKSTAAYLIARKIAKEVLEKHRKILRPYFMHESELLRMMSFDPDRLQSISRSHDILVIDDLGISKAGMWTDQRVSHFHELVDSRWSRNQMTIITSNKTIEELSKEDLRVVAVEPGSSNKDTVRGSKDRYSRTDDCLALLPQTMSRIKGSYYSVKFGKTDMRDRTHRENKEETDSKKDEFVKKDRPGVAKKLKTVAGERSTRAPSHPRKSVLL